MIEPQYKVQVWKGDRKIAESLSEAKEIRKLLFKLKNAEGIEIVVHDSTEWEAIEEEPVIVQVRKKYQHIKVRRKNNRNWKTIGVDARNG